MSYAFDKDAKDGDVVTLENGVAYQYDEAKDRWLVKDVAGSGSGEDWGFPLPEEQGNYVSKEGGDEMEGPLKIKNNSDPNMSSRQGRKIEVLGIYSGTENSALRLGTDRDRVYVGDNDTSFNGPIKVDEIQEKTEGAGVTHKNTEYFHTGIAIKTPNPDAAEAGHPDYDFHSKYPLMVKDGKTHTRFGVGVADGDGPYAYDENLEAFQGTENVDLATVGLLKDKAVTYYDAGVDTIGELNLKVVGSIADDVPLHEAHINSDYTRLALNHDPIGAGAGEGRKDWLELFPDDSNMLIQQGDNFYELALTADGAKGQNDRAKHFIINFHNIPADALVEAPLRVGNSLREEQVPYLTSYEAHKALEIKVDELEQELDIVAPVLEAASYTYVGSPSVKTGEMHVASGTFTAGTDVVLFNDVALDGNTHGWAALSEGDYLEITDTLETRTAQNYAMYRVTKAPEGSGMKQIEVALVKGQGGPTVGDVMDAKSFQLGGNDINDLDGRYAGKEAEHLNIAHQAENTSWYNAPHKLGIVPANIQTEAWDGSYERLKREGQNGLLAFTTKSPSSSGSITWKSWSQITEGQILYLRNTDSRLDNTSLKKMAAEDIGSVIVMRQPSTGAELSLHVRSTNDKTSGGVTEHASYVQIRRKRGTPTEDGEWRVYLQKEYLSAKGHDHYVGRLNSREDRVLKKWKSLSGGEFSLSEATGNPELGDGCYSWDRGRWFKIYSGQFSGSIISGDYNNGLGIVTVQKGNTIYCGYLTLSEASNYNGDHTYRTQSFMGQYEKAAISEWNDTFILSTNGLIQNTRTQYKENTYTNVYALGSPDEDIENPERPIWTGDNFGDFKNLDDFVAELKSADPEGSSIEFLMEQWQTYWYTPGR